MTNKDRIGRIIVAAAAVAFAGVASAQYPPQNWANAPTGSAWQRVFPYPGQCAVNAANAAALGVLQCTTTTAPSFLCDGNGRSNQSASPTAPCGSIPLSPPRYTKLLTGDTQRNFKYLNEVLNPLDYTPDVVKYRGADYYEIAVHESWGYQAIATAGTALGLGQNGVPGVFPDPTVAKTVPPSEPLAGTVLPAAGAVPDGSQWTGLRDPGTGTPLYTPIWGIGQVNLSGGPITATLADVGTCSLSKAVCFVSARPTTCRGAPQGRRTDVCQPTPLFNPAKQTSTSWSKNNYVSTWPSISIRGKAGTPVVVKWINEFPNNHLFCPHPEAADWPCAIDRTFMGVKASINPATAPPTFQNSPLPYDAVNQYGSPMQPDNSWVTHLHGGEIPPQTDGFAEKWFGNAVTGKIYSPQPWPLDPVFNAPQGALTASKSAGPAGPQFGNIFRPGGPAGANVGGFSAYNFDTYSYPMVNRESTIWFHDHTLGKTHHNVVAGPAGFFPVIEPLHHGTCANNNFDPVSGQCRSCAAVAPVDCEYSWLDRLSNPRGPLGMPKYDLFLAIQDRDFNADGTINFPNGMANVDTSGNPLSGYPAVNGTTPFVPGPNPQVHPVWVPEYFASNAVVNGVLWPKRQVEPGFYRVRFVDGSDARCYNLAFNTTDPWAGGTLNRPANDLSFTVIANEQGYLPAPVVTTQLTMCPGERYEVILDFTALAGQKVYVINDAAAPFPGGGNGPFTAGSPYADMATIMRFDVVAQATPSADLVTNLVIPTSLDADFVDATKFPSCNGGPSVGQNCIAAVRNLYLAEKIDGTTGASLGLQINGVPFEYDVTETPKKGTYEQWNIINLTVDAHPMHPHLAKFQIVGRQDFDVARYRLALCQSNGASLGGSYPPGTGASWADNFGGIDNNCSPGMAPGGVMQLIPDIASGTPVVDQAGNPTGAIIPFLLGSPHPADPTEAGWKDAMRAMPGQVLSIVGKWDGSWNAAATLAAVTAPGAGNTSGVVGANPAHWTYPDVTSGPYVWHCHINSHEDSEMMRSSLVVK